MVTFTAKKSGPFDDVTTWSTGAVPSGKCSIVVPADFTVTFTGTLLEVEVTTLTLSGTFTIISTGGIGFGFSSAINIIIKDGGSLVDETDNNRLYVRPDTVFTFLSGASFTGTETEVSTFTGSAPGDEVGSSVTFGSSISGPSTFVAFVDGTTKQFDSVMCAVRRSGEFSEAASWLGGIAPTGDFCESEDGCDMYIPSGFTLSTGSLNGVLNIQFNVVSVVSGATLALEAKNAVDGFRFGFSVELDIFGELSFAATTNSSLIFPFSSQFNFYSGAIFSADISVSVMVSESVDAVATDSGIVLYDGYSEAIFLDISNGGGINIDTTRK